MLNTGKESKVNQYPIAQWSISIKPDIFQHSSQNDINSELDSLAQLKQYSKNCTKLFSLTDEQDFPHYFQETLSKQLQPIIHQIQSSFNKDQKHLAIPIAVNNAQNKELMLLCNISLDSSTKDAINADISALNITELNRSEKKLKEALLRYELVFEGAFGAVWDWDIVAETIRYSDSWYRLRKTQKSESTNSAEEWENCIHPDDRERIFQAIDEHFAGKTKFFEEEYRIERADGSYLWIADRGVAKRNEQGEVIRMAGSVFDVSEQHEVKEHLLLAASVFENITEAAIILNNDAQIIRVNTAFSTILGYSQEQALNKNFSSFFSSQQKDQVNALIHNKKFACHEEVQMRRQDNSYIPCQLTVNHVFNAKKQQTHSVCLISDISENKKTEKLLFDLAHQDPLTGLPNRLSLNKRLEILINQAKRHQKQLAVLFIDLDNFKYINDGLGHLAGDDLLQRVAITISQSVRKEDFVARLGGDEFIVLIEDVSKTTEVAHAANNLLKHLNSRITIQEKEVVISASVGIALYPNDGLDSNTLISNADAAMYKAKEQGKQSYQFYTEKLTKQAVERMILEAEIDRALVNNEFVLHYQPQLDISNNKLIGLEALIRWQSIGKALIYPDKFIPVAEQTSTILEIGRWVLETACKQAVSWLKQGYNFGTVSVNISAKQLGHNNLFEVTKQTLKTSQLPAKYLQLEITESFILQEPQAAIEQLIKIRALGVTLAIDDFGTGYSSLSSLKKLPLHRLKIDKSFISDIPFDKNDTAITEAIIVMADRLDLEVIAEGVETQEQAQFLLNNGCSKAQGYFYSRPIPSDEVEYRYLKNTL